MEEKEREREDLVQKMVTREKTRLVTKNTPRKDIPCFLSFFFSKQARVRTSFCIRRYANEVRENVAKLIECKLDYIIWIRE